MTTRSIIQHCLTALAVMASGNDYVQNYLYGKLDSLLAARYSGKELALLLIQVQSPSFCVIIEHNP